MLEKLEEIRAREIAVRRRWMVYLLAIAFAIVAVAIGSYLTIYTGR